MVLDAATFELILTPEAALGIIQKEVAHRRWRKIEVEEIRLVYTPYYLFSFDVKGEANAPPITGKAALNAYTGDISDFIPFLLERPLKKTKTTGEGAEVEETAISPSEAKETAREKIAAQTGLNKEMVAVSAFSKVYIPFFRVWLEVAHHPLKVEVDAFTGTPMGMEGLPEREKSWGEATSETLSKLKSPSGWAELTGKAVSSLSGKGDSHGAAGGAHGGGEHGAEEESGKQKRWLILLGVIAVLVYLLFLRPSTGINCSGEIQDFGTSCVLQGVCDYKSNDDTAPVGEGVQIYVKEDGEKKLDSMANVFFFGTTSVPYNITWKPFGRECRKYGWGYDSIG